MNRPDKRARLVAVVGGDGVGKTTVARSLVARLGELGHSARYVRRWDIVDSSIYPEADFLNSDVGYIRNCAVGMPPNPRFLFLIWTMALAVLGDAVRKGGEQFVVADGYWMKHAASEVAYGLTPEWVLSVTSGLPQADVVLRLNLSPAQAWARKDGDVWLYECGMDESCSRESFVNHQARISTLLDQWSDEFDWQEIDGSLQLRDVVDTALRHTLMPLEA